MSKFWRFVLIVILIFSIYHLIRDIATDLIGFHSSIFDIGHRKYTEFRWCSWYCIYTTFPLEGFNIFAVTKILRRNKIGTLGNLVLLSLIYWIYAWFSGSGPLLKTY